MSNSVRPHRWQPTGSSIPGILQARTLEWVAIAFSGPVTSKILFTNTSSEPDLGYRPVCQPRLQVIVRDFFLKIKSSEKHFYITPGQHIQYTVWYVYSRVSQYDTLAVGTALWYSLFYFMFVWFLFGGLGDTIWNH